MSYLNKLSDSEIDSLLLLLFDKVGANCGSKPQPVKEISDADLLRIRSRNHPDKWPNVDKAAYQAAVEELARRRKARKLG